MHAHGSLTARPSTPAEATLGSDVPAPPTAAPPVPPNASARDRATPETLRDPAAADIASARNAAAVAARAALPTLDTRNAAVGTCAHKRLSMAQL